MIIALYVHGCEQCSKISVLLKRNRDTKREAVLKCSASALYLLAKFSYADCCEMFVHIHMFTHTYTYIHNVYMDAFLCFVYVFFLTFFIHVSTLYALCPEGTQDRTTALNFSGRVGFRFL